MVITVADAGNETASDMFGLTVVAERAGTAAESPDASASGDAASQEAAPSADRAANGPDTGEPATGSPDADDAGRVIQVSESGKVTSVTAAGVHEELGPGLIRSAHDLAVLDSKEQDEGRGTASGSVPTGLVDTLEAFFARTAHTPLDHASRQLDGTPGRHATPSATKIARRWDAVARYAEWLASHPDTEAEDGAALDWPLAQSVPGAADFGSGAGYASVRGVGLGAANLQALRGLAEGFQQLLT